MALGFSLGMLNKFEGRIWNDRLTGFGGKQNKQATTETIETKICEGRSLRKTGS